MSGLTQVLQVYRCEVCGNMVLVLRAGRGSLVCCGQPMTLLAEKTAGPGSEKHLPVVEEAEGGLKVVVGSTRHPMEEGHLIEWVAAAVDGEVHMVFLRPGAEPEVFLPLAKKRRIEVRAYCNKHGLWKTEVG